MTVLKALKQAGRHASSKTDIEMLRVAVHEQFRTTIWELKDLGFEYSQSIDVKELKFGHISAKFDPNVLLGDKKTYAYKTLSVQRFLAKSRTLYIASETSIISR